MSARNDSRLGTSSPSGRPRPARHDPHRPHRQRGRGRRVAAARDSAECRNLLPWTPAGK